MVWRGMIMLLNYEKLSSWDWSQVLENILHCANDVLRVLRKDNKIFEQFVLETVTHQRFLYFVQLLQSYVTISILSGLFKNKSIEYTVRILDVFNEANNKKDIKHRIGYKDFHNDAINKEVNLKDHYVAWI